MRKIQNTFTTAIGGFGVLEFSSDTKEQLAFEGGFVFQIERALNFILN